jgi:hypothetical protein
LSSVAKNAPALAKPEIIESSSGKADRQCVPVTPGDVPCPDKHSNAFFFGADRGGGASDDNEEQKDD